MKASVAEALTCVAIFILTAIVMFYIADAFNEASCQKVTGAMGKMYAYEGHTCMIEWHGVFTPLDSYKVIEK